MYSNISDIPFICKSSINNSPWKRVEKIKSYFDVLWRPIWVLFRIWSSNLYNSWKSWQTTFYDSKSNNNSIIVNDGSFRTKCSFFKNGFSPFARWHQKKSQGTSPFPHWLYFCLGICSSHCYYWSILLALFHYCYYWHFVLLVFMPDKSTHLEKILPTKASNKTQSNPKSVSQDI